MNGDPNFVAALFDIICLYAFLWQLFNETWVKMAQSEFLFVCKQRVNMRRYNQERHRSSSREGRKQGRKQGRKDGEKEKEKKQREKREKHKHESIRWWGMQHGLTVYTLMNRWNHCFWWKNGGGRGRNEGWGEGERKETEREPEAPVCSLMRNTAWTHCVSIEEISRWIEGRRKKEG